MKENWILDPRLAHLPVHMRGDEYTRILNESVGAPLCEHCGGTGNELMSMYRKCDICNGTGNMNKIRIEEEGNGLSRAQERVVNKSE